MASESDKWNRRTQMVHSGTRRSQYGEVSEAIFLTQGFVYDTAEAAEARFIKTGADEFVYARYGNPTLRMFEDRMAALEGAEDAFACASGMAAVNAVLMACLQSGDRVVAAKALFGSCLYILEDVLARYGVDVALVDGCDMAAWRAAIDENTKLVFFESVANPTLEVTDISSVSEIAHKVGALVVVDNVFATQTYSQPLLHGADVVIYSTTKHVDGQGRCLGGVILGRRDFIRGTIEPYLKHTGGALSPFNGWVMLKGLETMDLRVTAQGASATHIAAELQGHAALNAVLFPGLAGRSDAELVARQMGGNGGTVLSLDLKGGQPAAFRFLNALKIVVISNNLGDTKSIITHPATTTHQRLSDAQRADLGITPGLVRLSVGLEDVQDLVRDVLQALDAV